VIVGLFLFLAMVIILELAYRNAEKAIGYLTGQLVLILFLVSILILGQFSANGLFGIESPWGHLSLVAFIFAFVFYVPLDYLLGWKKNVDLCKKAGKVDLEQDRFYVNRSYPHQGNSRFLILVPYVGALGVLVNTLFKTLFSENLQYLLARIGLMAIPVLLLQVISMLLLWILTIRKHERINNTKVIAVYD
jgi:hypothetical protein